MPPPLSQSAQLARSADALQQVVDYARRLSQHADGLPPATAKTADLYVALQSLSEDADAAAAALRSQCLACLEGLAAVQGLSCDEATLDAILNRIFSGGSELADAPSVMSMSSSDALATSTYLDGLQEPGRLDSLLAAVPMPPAGAPSEEEHALLRQLSIEGGAVAHLSEGGALGERSPTASERTRAEELCAQLALQEAATAVAAAGAKLQGAAAAGKTRGARARWMR